MPFVSAADAGNDLIVQEPFCFALGDMTELAKLLQTDKPVDKYEPIVFSPVMEAPPSKSSAMAGGCVSRFFSPFSPAWSKKARFLAFHEGNSVGSYFFRIYEMRFYKTL